MTAVVRCAGGGVKVDVGESASRGELGPKPSLVPGEGHVRSSSLKFAFLAHNRRLHACSQLTGGG